jgi:thiamine-phosphate pyrophosphorylase
VNQGEIGLADVFAYAFSFCSSCFPLCIVYEENMRNSFFKLMLVTNRCGKPLGEYLEFIACCVRSGVTSVQLREKNLSFDELLEFGRELQSVLSPLSIPLMINDNVELAYQLDADGIHLGQSDGSVLMARKRLGDQKLIGLSVGTVDELEEANALPIDYIGLGVVFPTKNKDVKTVLGYDGLTKLAKLSKFPVVAIGGINETNIDSVLRSGAWGVAAIGAFHDALDPSVVTKNLIKSMV